MYKYFFLGKKKEKKVISFFGRPVLVHIGRFVEQVIKKLQPNNYWSENELGYVLHVKQKKSTLTNKMNILLY